ncbi:sacsin N-terminal ATP-binding-like domain-containing protein [Lacinutrix algicola]|uniref:sacsin N-terminal ATP-binding-like domain-containing protein n=1 Tax=Lacinutrix algicola TaxID=342954 RepID=UPI0006E1A145|nr:DUF3883 domain-containing protein [Lacinutrix algicola]
MEIFVKKQIEKKIGYLKDFDYLLKEYNEENEITKGYNGRQILELLQNCDDEGSTEVLIKLDKETNTITVSNNGTPFSEKGYKSLFMPFRSSKISKKDFIGNKGLGFRSIINWSTQIEIQSNNLSLIYNQESRKDFFYTHFNEDKRNAILREEGLIETAIPVPFLGIPKVESIETGNYVTSIVITYLPSFLNSIIKQVKSITPETLFFLKSLQLINFEGFDECVKSIETHKEPINSNSDDFAPTEKITYNGNTWHIFKEEESLGEVLKSDKIEEEFYQIKIAIEENMAKPTGKLYSFFPTNIYLGQPYILHATFDLDSTRNQLVQSDKNRIILKKTVQFTIKVAKYFTQEKVSYKPLQILHHSYKADTLNNLGYYNLIDAAFKKEEIFPCVNNTYSKLNQVVYYGDSFAKMLQKIKATEILGFHLQPTENINLTSYSFFAEIYSSFENIKDVVTVLNNITALPLTIEQRALFVHEIVKKSFELKKNHKNKLNLLIDREENPILGDEYVYTPETKDSTLKTPGFTKIKFINRKLYFSLSELLGYNTERDKNRGRFVTDKLQGLCNIHSFEPATLARKIISETKIEIKKPDVNKVEVIQEMNSCLFHNFEFINQEAIKTPLPIDIPTIALNGDVVVSSNTILSSTYPNGHANQIIFEGIYTEKDYIANTKELGINLDSIDELYKVQDYLLWLKVNEHAKYEYKEFNNYGADNYFRSIHKDSYTRYTLNIINIEGFNDILNNISLENFILWIYFDSKLKGQLYNDSNKDKVEYLYRTKYFYREKTSFIKYLIGKHYKIKFSNLLIDEKYNWVNDFEINYRHPLFSENNLSKSVIQEILVALGAKDNFNDLPIVKVADIINKLGVKYPDGSKSVTFYKKALSHYKENKTIIHSPVQLFADDGEKLNSYNQEQVYFSEKIKLPKKLKKDFPIFNFPARSGGVEAIKFFGINDLNDIKIELESYQILEKLTSQFNEHLTKLKPYILAQRIHDYDDLKSQQIQASICNKIKLVLCPKLDYKVNEKEYQTSTYEYIHVEEHTYYMKVNSFDELNNLINNSDFTDNIAEILALSFDVKSDKTEFRNIIRSNIEVVKSDIIRDFSEDTLKEANELLGLADYKQAFWKAIFTLKTIEYDEGLDDIALNVLVLEKLKVSFDVAKLDYEDISGTNQIKKLKNLFNELSINLKDFSNTYPYKTSYQRHHFKSVRDVILSNKSRVKSAIWNKLNTSSLEDKKSFLTKINQLEEYEYFTKEISEENKHEFKIDVNDIFNNYIKSIYGDLKLEDTIDFYEMLVSNRLSFTDSELELINQDIELKSVLHFKNVLVDLKSILELQLKAIENNETNNNDHKNQLPTNELEVVSSEKLKLKTNQFKRAGNRKPFLPGKENKGKLKQIGNASEDCVMKYLKDNNYSNIYKVSDDNEGLHYDIRFTDEKGNIKFIEVKTFNTGMFYLSKDEFNFGKENQGDYEIWLVKNGKTIIPIKDFYTNTKYQPIANEYIVYLDIE